ncbi:MAG: selenide, water dikinase SelD [Candidatus Eisenbacteria bacterium]|nr:selenide, water dikinase SelD [Candidatus Eisenbacteria bacterium]
MGPEDLADVLRLLPPVSDPRVLVSSDTVDDAGVYLMEDGTALVFTVDFFTPVVDDPRDYGRIAAANSLSDVYAMGGSPMIALNIMCFSDGDLPSTVMAEILLGSQEKAAEAGVLVLGGHSVSDRELKFGLAVVGRVAPDKIVSNAGARPGDRLVLTKPVGLGVLSTALKEGKLGPDGTAAITAIMASLNRSASEAMVESSASAATDVTGFGLIGHAVEMANASGVTLEVSVEDVPIIDGALEALGEGLAPGGLFSNHHYYGRFADEGDRAGQLKVELLYDPQTSGGLLVAMHPGRLDRFLETLRERGVDGWVVGRVVDRADRSIALV